MGTLKGGMMDSKPKFGLRLGVEYQFNSTWGVTLDYNASEWRSQADGEDASGSTYPIKGWNPINPSWVALSIQYRFTSLK